MSNGINQTPNLKIVVAACILALMILLGYLNTFKASWHLDDYSNINKNSVLHINNLEFKSLFQTFYSSPTRPGVIGRKLYRPIPCLTFAVNWYFGKDNVFGYHLVNIAVHILTAWILFFTVINLLRAPNLIDKFPGRQYLIAFLCAALWALNPIQTQAINYIVQRMASMAAMFYILGIFFYLKFRLSDRAVKRIIFLLSCLTGFVLALGSKENTLTLPVALLLIEIICFQDLDQRHTRRNLIWGSIGVGVFLIVFGILFFTPGAMLSLFNGYDNRPFTLAERLLTEPRILIFYISQIFYPVSDRLSIEHDIEISTSLFQPWTTVPSILLILVLVGFGFWQIRKRPLVALAILFFFLNHIIESSIIPLELIFEHRNYLPTLFLFFPVAVGFSRALEYYGEKSPRMKLTIAGGMFLLIGCMISSTYIRNLAWATEKTLWEDAMIKAPNSNRPLHNLAWGYYTKTGQYDKALELYAKSLDRQRNNNFAKSLALNNMALIHFHRKDFPQANLLWNEALDLNPGLDIIRYRYVIGLVEMADWETALHNVNLLLTKYPRHIDYNYIKGRILLNQGDYESAQNYFKNGLELKPDSTEIMLNLGICYYLRGQLEPAEAVFRKARVLAPGDQSILLWLIETNIKANDSADVDRYVSKLTASTPGNQLISYLKNNFNDPYLQPTAKSLIIQKVKRRLAKNSPDIHEQ
jgi:tetratricopeptide (TPR) repeat protein